MWAYLANPAIQMIALFSVAGLIIALTAFTAIKAYLKLKTKTKSLSEIAEDGERTKARLERYTDKLSGDDA